VTAADRPSVTDDARAEAGRIDQIDCMDCGAKAVTMRHFDQCSAVWGAAGRAEPTTATTEDAQTGTFEAILAAHRDEYDSDCGMYFGCSCGWDNDDIGSNEGYVEHVAGLLATARTRPTREQIAKVLADTEPDVAPGYYEPQADAVLALLRGGTS